MKEILLIHPIGQTLASLFGLFNLITGCTRRWFHISLHVNCGVIYYFIALLGTGAGIIATRWAQGNNIMIDMTVHEICAMLLVLVLAMGATTGFTMLSNNNKRNALIKYHLWGNIIGYLLFCLQGITGIITLLEIY
ncbi:MAG: hypothetical protein WCQ99_12130 [Pseudomonadota bacterium]|jgi:hypothetical protein